MKPKVLVVSGYGINCEMETSYAFEVAGGSPKIVHINDIIDGHEHLADYQILAFPGGFSYGDDTGSGKAFANRVRSNLWEEVIRFIEDWKLVIGICNGFQVLANLGLVPAIDGEYGKPHVALTHNDSVRYQCEWVDLEVCTSKSLWLDGLTELSMPIAHGEGKFYADSVTHQRLVAEDSVALRYAYGEMCDYLHKSEEEKNPNGSLDDIAGIIDLSGRVLGLMPHPERAIILDQRPDSRRTIELCRREGTEPWLYQEPIKIFANGVDYFK